jgi:ABC-type multidrug transport system fused ATPase/permease subunit
VEQGRIIQTGTHAKLTQRTGLYRNMHLASKGAETKPERVGAGQI